ncbi:MULTISPECIES: tyrosine-type recombinase/integrase [unclassified Bacillus (in: firmicutes)]|uniref:tyrosine-type recombinase/integrase n=1 Tax=unclassified Bacillus (in: firmicutes) TaxID=185979 RepID=UPI0020C71CB5|nr:MULTISPECIES: tyrosine-type recombinase/integrase [unclassified Bacillus (in: firmicutes)]
MEIRKLLNESSFYKIESIQQISKDDLLLKDYKQIFDDLVESEIIKSNSFEENLWFVYDPLSQLNLQIKFDLISYPKINEHLKFYMLLRLISGKTPKTIYDELASLRKIILSSQGFGDLIQLKSVLVESIEKYKYLGYHMVNATSNFIDFYRIDNYQEILNICSNMPNHSKTSRDLPDFQDVLELDDIINHYFKNHNVEETISYTPILVWWLLTNTLPMRPSELLKLKKDCLSYDDSKNEPYTISIPRIKNKSATIGFSIKYDSVVIDQKTYQLLKEIRDKVNIYFPYSEYFFPSEMFSLNYKVRRKKKNPIMNLRNFNDLKDQFYKIIVEEKYGRYNLERVKAGDTRHFAIINMCLQGFSMHNIATLAGHTELRVTQGYFSHAKHFVQSYVYRLAQLKLETEIGYRMDNSIIGWKKYIVHKSNIEKEKITEIHVGRVQYGLCSELKGNFPNTCIEFCEFCPKYIFSPSINEKDDAIKWLSSHSEDLKHRIEEAISLLESLFSLPQRHGHDLNTVERKSAAKRLQQYMELKSKIDANIAGDKNGKY